MTIYITRQHKQKRAKRHIYLKLDSNNFNDLDLLNYFYNIYKRDKNYTTKLFDGAWRELSFDDAQAIFTNERR